MVECHVLLASVFYQRQPNGSLRRYRCGDVIEGLDDADRDRLLASGGLRSKDDVRSDAGVPPPAAPGAVTGVEPARPDRSGSAPYPPPRIATKSVLVDWLSDNAGLDRAELGEQSKDDLWALIDAARN